MNGWIKLYRKLLDDVVWIKSSNEQRVILITLLLLASHTEKEWEWQGKKFKVMPGQFVTSIDSIIKACGGTVTQKNVRSAIVKFEKLGFLANQSAKTGRLITIKNWEKYQNEISDSGKDMGKEVADNWQRGGKEVASIKNDKNDKNVKNDKNNIYIIEIIDYLNERLNTTYKATTSKTKELINARLNEGFTIEDFKTVIDKKANEWIGTEWEKYLRPNTLFSNKFESYLNQVNATNKNKNTPNKDLLEMIKNGEFDKEKKKRNLSNGLDWL